LMTHADGTIPPQIPAQIPPQNPTESPSGIPSEARAALVAAADSHPYPLLFATISGAHLYGFPSADSDWDMRGCHVLPAREVLGLGAPRETIEIAREDGGLDLDLVTHDATKFFRLLLRKNGYVLEQLFSPLVICGGEQHEELKSIAHGCITRHHAHHYLGFARNQWKLFQKDQPRRVKPLLYSYRALLTGIHLMRSGEFEANLVRLLEMYPLPGVADLISLKLEGSEDATIPAEALSSGGEDAHHAQGRELRKRLVAAAEETDLPGAATSAAALSDFLVRIRLGA
jgi:predicted nucleotidyltransferase